MTPHNTLRNELIEMMPSLTSNTGEEYHKLHDGKQDFETTDSKMRWYESQTVDAILSVIKNRLPKEREVERGIEHWDWGNYDDSYNYGRDIGYADCLAEVRQALDIESEGARE